MRRLALTIWYTFVFLLGFKAMERYQELSGDPPPVPAEWSMCERRYFDPSCVPYEPPTVFRVRVPEDFKRAWEYPGPVIITLDMWPVCYVDGTLREGDTFGRYFEPNGGA